MVFTRKTLLVGLLSAMLLSGCGMDAMGVLVRSIGIPAQRVLWRAATLPNIAALKSLLFEHSVDPNFRATVYDSLVPELYEQVTPLMAAVMRQHINAVRMMLASGKVDVNHGGLTKDGMQFTALDCAVMDILRTKARIASVLSHSGDPTFFGSPAIPGVGHDLYHELGKQELLADLLHHAGGTRLLLNGVRHNA